MAVSVQIIKRYIKMASQIAVLGICHVFSVYERGTFFVKMVKGKGLDLGGSLPVQNFFEKLWGFQGIFVSRFSRFFFFIFEACFVSEVTRHLSSSEREHIMDFSLEKRSQIILYMALDELKTKLDETYYFEVAQNSFLHFSDLTFDESIQRLFFRWDKLP